MAGYNWGRGMSNNAVAAKEEGKKTAGELARLLKCETGAVKDRRPAPGERGSGRPRDRGG